MPARIINEYEMIQKAHLFWDVLSVRYFIVIMQFVMQYLYPGYARDAVDGTI